MKKLTIISIITISIIGISITSISAQSQYDIPVWVKGVAGFWAEDKISDDEFGEGLSFLIDNGIIKVPLIVQLENRIAELEKQVTQLQAQLDSDETDISQESSITVSLDKSSYKTGDKVRFSGKITKFEPTTAVTYVIKNPNGSLANIAQVFPDSNGSFSHSFELTSSFNLDGKYVIEFAYHDATTATSFNYELSDTAVIITANLDQTNYKKGDTILISGKVSSILENEPITTQIFFEDESIDIAQFEHSNDGTFTHTVNTSGPVWKYDGTYHLRIFYGGASLTKSISFSLNDNTPTGGVASLKTSEPIFSIDDEIIFTGFTNKENTSVFVIIRSPSGDFKGMASDPSSDEDGSFETIPRPVSNFFNAIGKYTATAFTDEQKEQDGVTIQLEYDGNFVSLVN